MSKWDRRFLELAKLVSTWSKDKRQVGSVITDWNRVISIGYNGFPAGIADDSRLHDHETKLSIAIHAEENAILASKRDLTGLAIYIYPFPPCPSCASKIIQVGISRVITQFPQPYYASKYKLDFVVNLFHEAGVKLHFVGMQKF